MPATDWQRTAFHSKDETDVQSPASCTEFVIFISAWAILLFVQQYRAFLTASECGSDNGRFTLFCVATHHPARLWRHVQQDMEHHSATPNVRAEEGSPMPPSTRLAPGALPETQSAASAKSSHTGVSTRSVSSSNPSPSGLRHWYALRATYGRESRANVYLCSRGIPTYCPTIRRVKEINGKRVTVTEARILNVFFAYGTEDELCEYVFRNVHFHYLRFYYQYTHTSHGTEKTPMIIPDHEMESLRIICSSNNENILLSTSLIPKFKQDRSCMSPMVLSKV